MQNKTGLFMGCIGRDLAPQALGGARTANQYLYSFDF